MGFLLIVFSLVGVFWLVWGCGVSWFFCSKQKSLETIEEPYHLSLKSHLDLIEDTSSENDHSHSVACGVSCAAYGKLPDQLNMNILAKFKPVQ